MALDYILAPVAEVITRILDEFLMLIPGLVGALIILLVGYVVGRLVGSTVRIFLAKILGLDEWLRRKGLADAAYGISLSQFIAGSIKWYIYIVFIGAAVSRLRVGVLTDFMDGLIGYFPRIIAGAVIIFFGLIFGEWVKRRIMESRIIFKDVIGGLAKLGVVFMFLVTSFSTMMIDATPLLWLLTIVVGGVVLTFALALGIGLGLALKDEIRPYVKRLLEELGEGRGED
jgi:hypothetical protein